MRAPLSTDAPVLLLNQPDHLISDAPLKNNYYLFIQKLRKLKGGNGYRGMELCKQ